MKIYFLFLTLLSVSMAWAQIETERVLQKTIPEVTDAEAREALLHEAVSEALDQYSTEIGIDSASLKSKLEERFNHYIDVAKRSRLAQTFPGKSFSDLSPDELKTFEETLAQSKDKDFRAFAKFSSLLNSYSFKSLEKDPEGPWKAIVVLNLNKQSVLRLAQKLSVPEDKQFTKLLVIPEVNLMGLDWADLGLETSQGFTDPLLSSWTKWMANTAPMNVEEISPCLKSCEDDFSRWQEIKQDQGMEVLPEHVNGLWLKIAFNLRKLLHRPEINEWQFEWDGSVLLLDANTKSILGSYNLLRETKTWRGLDQKGLNSHIASGMYRSALDALNRANKKVQDSSRVNRMNRLVIQGQRNLGDVLSLIEMVKKEGAGLNLQLQLDAFSTKEAEVLCFYRGEEKSFTNLLSRLKELKSPQGYRLVNEFTGVHHVLKLSAE